MKKRRREAQAAPGGSPPPLGPGEIGPNNARNRAMKKRRREAQAAQAAPGGSPPPLGPVNESFLLFQWQKAKLPVPGGIAPPLGPGEIGPNNARNRALKKRRRQAQAAREQAAVVEARRRELENEFAHDMVRARANARLAEEFGPEAAKGGGAPTHGGNFRGMGGRGSARGRRGRGGPPPGWQ
ncbi:hypothetical protein N7489_000473 [Penicillium chrysogenum]|uniref:uncharacterized protein n=1 Tax=Penicillium chrysogenum TaxID=5076 RepID=UPI0024DF1E2F|nr:uncharacterized protein N7489_000473 [Penicillium chrysogenum]KAJ5250063.1 hypothetical protein N7489_000473 [Penicillium chrysogenum]